MLLNIRYSKFPFIKIDLYFYSREGMLRFEMELLRDLLLILFAEELICFTIRIIVSIVYLFQLLHAIENPIVREFATDRAGFAMVFTVMLGCFLHHLWLLSFSSKMVVIGIGSILVGCMRP